MWLNDLEEKLLKVDKCEDLKYLPPTEVENLQLNELGCEADAILVHEEYLLTFKELEMYRPNIGGIILTGQPGIGTTRSFLQKDMSRPAHVLITCKENLFFCFIYCCVSLAWGSPLPTTW